MVQSPDALLDLYAVQAHHPMTTPNSNSGLTGACDGVLHFQCVQVFQATLPTQHSVWSE